MEYEELGKGLLKRKQRRILGLFIDGTGLDRATRRINRKVDMTNLVRGVTSGVMPTLARYYTLIPYEDDSRQRAFLDAVERAGLDVVVKRLPPKGVTRQVSVDVEMSTDMVAFALGHSNFKNISGLASTNGAPEEHRVSTVPLGRLRQSNVHEEPAAPKSTAEGTSEAKEVSPNVSAGNEERILTVVCPSRELSYTVAMIKVLGVDTVTADFGQFKSNDILKSAAKWIDLSDSETIWRDS